MIKLTSVYRELAANFSALMGLKSLNEIDPSSADTAERLGVFDKMPEDKTPGVSAFDLTICLVGFDLCIGSIDSVRLQRMTPETAVSTIGSHLIATAQHAVYGDSPVTPNEWQRSLPLRSALVNSLHLFMDEMFKVALSNRENLNATTIDDRTGERFGYKSADSRDLDVLKALFTKCIEDHVIAVEELGGLPKEKIGPATVTYDRLLHNIPDHSHKDFRTLAKLVSEIYAGN